MEPTWMPTVFRRPEAGTSSTPADAEAVASRPAAAAPPSLRADRLVKLAGCSGFEGVTVAALLQTGRCARERPVPGRDCSGVTGGVQAGIPSGWSNGPMLRGSPRRRNEGMNHIPTYKGREAEVPWHADTV